MKKSKLLVFLEEFGLVSLALVFAVLTVVISRQAVTPAGASVYGFFSPGGNGGGSPAPTVTLSADPASISSGNSSTLNFTSANADTLSIDNGVGSITPPNGNTTVSPTSTTTYTITAIGPGGTTTASATVTVTAPPPPPPPAPTASFSASPSSINNGVSSTLSWTTTNTTSVSINQGIGSVALNGSQAVSPTNTTTYTLTATGSGGTITRTATVTVTTSPTAPTVSLTASPVSISSGNSSTLSWTSTNATGWSINNGVGTVSGPSGSTTVSPTNTTTYTITATGAGGTVTANATVTVTTPPPPPPPSEPTSPPVEPTPPPSSPETPPASETTTPPPGPIAEALAPVGEALAPVASAVSETFAPVTAVVNQATATVTEAAVKVVKDTAQAFNNLAKQTLPAPVYEKAKEATATVVTAVKEVNAVRQSPVVQEVAATVAVPVTTVAVATAAVATTSVGNFILYLQFFLSQPLLFLGARKKKATGKVYNSLTGQPVELAIIRLYEATTNRLLQTKITDKEGHYQFTVGPGRYKLVARRENLDYPSTLLSQDYRGEVLEVKEARAVINQSIPLDPSAELSQAPASQLLAIQAKRNSKRLVTGLSIGIMVVSFIIRPTWGMFVILVVQFVLHNLSNALNKKQAAAKEFGAVVDSLRQLLVPKAVVRVLDPTYGRMLDYQVTDDLGRYSFLVGEKAKTYQLRAEKIGYETLTTESRTLAPAQKMITERLVIKPASKQTTPPPVETKTKPPSGPDLPNINFQQ